MSEGSIIVILLALCAVLAIWLAAERHISSLAAAEAEAEMEHERSVFAARVAAFKRVTASKLSFCYEPTGERVTVYFADQRSMDILFADPSIFTMIANAMSYATPIEHFDD